MGEKQPVNWGTGQGDACFEGVLAYRITSGFMDGRQNMAQDEALLARVCQAPEPVLIVRTYGWSAPTLSLGVNQPERDVQSLLSDAASLGESVSLVRRPTGGRAILHGEDISYAILTNIPDILRLSVRSSYCLLGKWVQSTVRSLGISVTSQSDSLQPSGRSIIPTKKSIPVTGAVPGTGRDSQPCATPTVDYTRSPHCFETRMADDLIIPASVEGGPPGKKVAGSAQLRRSGGLLQHGSLFLQPWLLADADGLTAFSEALFTTVESQTGIILQPAPDSLLSSVS